MFTDKVTKVVSEFFLRCVGEFEEQVMRVIAKNERLNGRIEDCERIMALMDASGSYASAVGKSAVGEIVIGTSGSKQAGSLGERVKEGRMRLRLNQKMIV